MPEPSQYMFNYKELLELLVKRAEIHEGKWQIVINFGLAGGNAGPTDAELVPAAIVAVTAIGLQKATRESPDALTIDAAVANPASA